MKATIVTNVLGKGFHDTLYEPFVQFGQDIFSRKDLVDTLGVGQMISAKRLDTILKALALASAAAMHKIPPTDYFRRRGFGVSTMFVLMCYLDHKGYDVETWWGWKQGDHVVKFSTWKHRARVRAKKRAV